jgi:hypothetical protein|tara:strand:- start:9729 stop:10169 length:441 start_codon:yes stop_codon:yes gene_type:complete
MLSVLTVSEVRDRIDTALADAGYTRSRFVPDLFGRDTDHLVSGSYSISTPATTLDQFSGRDQFTDEGEAETVVEIRTAYRIRPDSQSLDYGQALDQEHQVLRAALDLDTTYLQVRINGIPRRAVSSAGDWLVSTIRLTIFHRFTFA